MMLSPASLTLKFDAIIDVPEGDEALSDSALPLLFRPLSPRAVITSPGMPRSYSYYPPPAVEEIVVGSPSGSSPTLVASPATPGHRASARARGSPRSYVSSGSTQSHSGHRHHESTSQYVYAQPVRSTRSNGSVATVRERPRYERARSSGVKLTVIPATPRRVSRGSVVSYRPETDRDGKVKFSTKLRRLFGLGPKREEIKAERGRTTEYIYPAESSTHRRSTSRVVYT